MEGYDAAGTGCTSTTPCWIRVSTQYDANGRVAQTSRPYFVATGTPAWTVNTYDALGRVTLATFPDTSALATAYCGLRVSTTNANGQIRTTVSNYEGLVAEVLESATTTCTLTGHPTTYVYDGFSDLLTVTDAAGNTVANNAFDIRGRKTQSIDPDMGTWTYVYDGFGELALQTDAKSQVTTIAYDALGRVLTHNAAGFISTYVYDTAPGLGIGQLASATTGLSFTKAYTYDTLGRPSTLTLTEDGTPGVFTYSYDANSRLQSLAYPSGFTAAYSYAQGGYLYRITDNGTGHVLWTANTRDAELHLLTQTQGNSVVTTQAFSPDTGLVQSIQAGTGNSVANQTFTFDPLGNLISRTWLNGAAVVRENACYDGLNRVTSTLITTGTACTGAGGVTISYDLIGDITRKSDICNTANCFVYGGSGAGPHALTSIVGTYNGVVNPTFNYDMNGMLVAGGGRTVTATTFNMAALITDGSNQAAFSYDSEHARYKMVTTGVAAGATYYLNDPSGAMEEENIAGGVTTWRDYVMAEGKLTAERFCTGAAPCSTGASWQYFVLDHLGSVSVVVSSTGAILSQLSYDAWGKRRNPDGSAIDCTAGSAPPNGVTRGFTGQEMLDGLCLVNMNARVYDPSLGRFMSADPTVGSYTIPQELNRYSYVLNNPLSLTDPSGLCFLGCFWRDAIFRDILGIVAAFTFNYELLPALEAPGFAGTALGGLVNAGIAGGVGGAVSTGSLIRPLRTSSMSKAFGAQARWWRPFAAVAAIVLLAGAVGIAVQSWNQHREEGIAGFKAWMTVGPPCPPPPKAVADAPASRPAQIDDFGGVKFAREHGGILCNEVADDGGRGDGVFPVCQFDHPGSLEVSTRRGVFRFWAGSMSPATISVQHDMPSCVVGASQDFGHQLIYDAPPPQPRR